MLPLTFGRFRGDLDRRLSSAFFGELKLANNNNLLNINVTFFALRSCLFPELEANPLL
jgi:hypothetical protein